MFNPPFHFPHPLPTPRLMRDVVAKAKACGDEALEYVAAHSGPSGSFATGTEGSPGSGAAGSGALGGGWLAGYHTHDSMLKEDPTEVRCD